ncbi:calcium-binding protein [Acidimangrovimonas pyrenivorans]|uniref:Calcium-binding protein n=1 Tax=Acidimangrovimonas pyrenivorans TaxID=2030798 RepID=A0ABV7AEJ1_9RHOB
MALIIGTSGNDSLLGTAGDDTIRGLGGWDTLDGGGGNDRLNAGATDYGGGDQIRGSEGNDTIVYSAVSAGDGWNTLSYMNLGSGVTAVIDGAANTASVQKASGTDTIVDVSHVLSDMTDGFNIFGTTSADTFTVNAGSGTSLIINGGGGADTYNLTLSSWLRIDLLNGWFSEANQGAVVNLATGVIANDGFGYTDTLNVSQAGGWLEIRATDFNDNITGSDASERFILRGGNDTLHAGAGWDQVRYDRSGVDNLNVNLAQHKATGNWDGNAFTHHLYGVEEIRGTRSGNDVLIGDGAGNLLEARDGNDRLVGLGGDDTLRGGNGDDTLVGGGGRDHLEGGDGNDRIDASGGTVASQGYGDYIRPGLGHDTIIGHAGLYASDEGTDISYGDLSGVGGVTVKVGANGTGTAVSGDGRVNDHFTYIQYFEGSQDGDLIRGSNADRWEGFAGLGGADTIRGGGGWDALNYGYETDYGSPGNAIHADLKAGTIVDTFGYTDVVSGIDEVRGTDKGDVMTAAGVAGGIRFRGEGGNDRLVGGAGADRLEGSDGNDTLLGNNGADDISDGNGDDLVRGGDGNDVFHLGGGGGSDTIFGDAGQDMTIADLSQATPQSFTLFYNAATGAAGAVETTTGRDEIHTEGFTVIGDFDARLTGNGAGNQFMSDLGDDILKGAKGNDLLNSGGGNDTLFGGDGADTLYGGAGNDTVNGGNGKDKAFLGNGADLFQDNAQGGAAGADTVTAGGGNDTINGGAGADLFNGNAGNDRIVGGAGFDKVFGGGGNDTLNGGAGNDTVNGGDGQDRILGAAGADKLFGGGGADLLDGGKGGDVLTGGAGVDSFVFGKGYGQDRVVDFVDDVDQAKLHSDLWAGSLSASQIVANYAHADGNSVVLDFGNGDVLTVTGISDPALLVNDLIIG